MKLIALISLSFLITACSSTSTSEQSPKEKLTAQSSKKMVCSNEKKTGSRIREKRCMTQAQAVKEKRLAEEFLRKNETRTIVKGG
jgi:hypothetical protein